MIQCRTKGITVFQSELYETTSTVIESEKIMIVVDPNLLPKEVAKIRQYVDERLDNKQLYLVLTHSDYDHIIGAGAFPEAVIIATESFENNSDKQVVVEEIKQFNLMFYLTRTYEVLYPKVDITIKENETYLQLGDLECIFYLAPGHTADGLFFYIKKFNTLIVGDYLSDIEFPFITSSYLDYLQTVYQMRKVARIYEVELLVPGHGKATSDYEGRINFSLWYLEEIVKSVNIENQLMRRFSFYQGMESIHKNNVKLAKGRDEND